MAYEIIQAQVWQHKVTGRKASVWGAQPWTGAPGDMEADWEMVFNGWTAKWPDGTTGFMTPNPASREAAERRAAEFPKNFPGWNQG